LPIEKLQEFLNEHETYKQFGIDVEKSLVSRMKELILDSLMCAKVFECYM
jgi:hypothetical protein